MQHVSEAIQYRTLDRTSGRDTPSPATLWSGCRCRACDIAILWSRRF